MVVAARKHPIWVAKEERKEKSKEKTKGNGLHYRDLTISGHDLPHTGGEGRPRGPEQGGKWVRRVWRCRYSSLEGSLSVYLSQKVLVVDPHDMKY